MRCSSFFLSCTLLLYEFKALSGSTPTDMVPSSRSMSTLVLELRQRERPSGPNRMNTSLETLVSGMEQLALCTDFSSRTSIAGQPETLALRRNCSDFSTAKARNGPRKIRQIRVNATVPASDQPHSNMSATLDRATLDRDQEVECHARPGNATARFLRSRGRVVGTKNRQSTSLPSRPLCR